MISKEEVAKTIKNQIDFILWKTFELETGEIIKPLECIRWRTDDKPGYRFRCEGGKEIELPKYVFSQFSDGLKVAKGIFGERMILIE